MGCPIPHIGHVRTAAILLTLLSGAGCATPPSETAAPTISVGSTPMPPILACGTGRHYEPVDYTGSGPHPTLVENLHRTRGPAVLDPSLPPEWDASRGLELPRAALLVCGSDIQETSNVPIGECRYSPGRFNPYSTKTFDPQHDLAIKVYPSTQSFTVIVAKTGLALGNFTVAGDESAEYSCPAQITEYSSSPVAHVAQAVRRQTFAERVKPFITATVP